jgi:hypothetical protein
MFREFIVSQGAPAPSGAGSRRSFEAEGIEE